MSRFNSGNRYISSGIDSTLPQYVILMLWQYIDFLKDKCELDYLQVFRLYKEGEHGQGIEHTQEQPKPFKRRYTLFAENAPLVNTKVYVIDDETHETMILAEEY